MSLLAFFSTVVLVAVGVVLFLLAPLSIHKIEEGHVGVYWRAGALLTRTTQPGLNFKLPFLESYESVQVTIQTDKVMDIPCGTSGGVLIWIEKVEVVNRLKPEHVYATIKNYTIHYDKIWIFDKIHHEINQFCSKHTLQEVYIDLFHTVDDRLVQALQEGCDKWAPGIEIIAIRITKPKIPQNILKNFELMEAEKTKLLIATQAQKVIEKEAETERKRAIIETEKKAAIAKIEMEKQIMEKEAQRTMSQIDDDSFKSREISKADAMFYKAQKESESNAVRLTKELLMLEAIRAISNNTKIYFGDSPASMVLGFFQGLQEAFSGFQGKAPVATPEPQQ